MIVPSRWMKGGKGLDRFREEMISDTRIQILHDFVNAGECFANVHIDGGVCYFLWSNNYNGPLEYHYHDIDGSINTTKRFLKTDYTNTVIRDFRQLSLIKKTVKYSKNRFSSIVYPRNPYGFFANLFNSPERYPATGICDKPLKGFFRIFGVKGKKGGAKRVCGYINTKSVKKNMTGALNYKLFFSKAFTTTATVPPEIILAKPKEVCTETFLQIGNFRNPEEAKNCLEYIKTKFFRALLFFNRHSLNISRQSFELIPLQDFSQKWTDDKLYEKYHFTQDEIDYIESVIKPMK